MLRTGSAILLFCIAVSSTAQTLTCPNIVAAGCETFHYHIQAWSPEFRSTVELLGLQTFSSAKACEESRTRTEATNTEALKYLAAVAPRMKTQPNRYGDCHCDMTRNQTNPNYLDDPRRQYHVRTDQEFRNQLLGELLERGLASDADLALALGNPASKFHGAALWRNWPIPAEGPTRLLRPEGTVMLNTSVSAVLADGDWQKGLELAAVTIDRPTAGPEKGKETATSARENVFIRTEISKIQEIALAASQSDDSGTARVLRACAERMQLLSKLSRIMQPGAPDSLLTQAAAKAVYDDESLRKFISTLFGPSAAAHWEPSDPAEMSFDFPPEIDSNPAVVLQDAEERFSIDLRKLALYAFLVKNPLTESDERWLRSIAESHLAGE